MGTPMIDLINECGGMPEGDNKLLAGGPMMGKALTSVEVPICKGTNSVTILSGDEAKRKPAQPCIRCAKCVSACPMGLEPYLLATASALHDWEKLRRQELRRVSNVVHASLLVLPIGQCLITYVLARVPLWA